MALATDMSQVQEKLAALDEATKSSLDGSSDLEKADFELGSLHSDPPELPPKDYFEADEIV